MSPAATTAASLATTVTSIATGGVLAGALHAITGPDHLAALLPRCCGERWYKAGKIGALWGLGQTVAIVTLGSLAYALKSRLAKAPGVKMFLADASNVMEVAVGLSLIVVGVIGLREAKEYGEEVEENEMMNDDNENEDAWKKFYSPRKKEISSSSGLIELAIEASAAPKKNSANNNNNFGNRAVIFNGLLHGFSWDGAPSLAPALAVASWGGNLTFLSAYSFGIVGVMALATSFIGEGTRQASDLFNRPDLPQKLSFITSLFAIAIGVFWCASFYSASWWV